MVSEMKVLMRRSSPPSTAASKLHEVEPCRGARWHGPGFSPSRNS
jgi:hypothetical protein